MDASSIASYAPLISAGVTAVVGLTGIARGTGRLRNQLKADAEIATLLPPGLAKDRLLVHIEQTVQRLIEDESEKTRDLPMLAFALFVAPGLAALTAWLVIEGGWWQYALAVPTALLAVIFVYGIFETAQKAKRDERGMRKDE